MDTAFNSIFLTPEQQQQVAQLAAHTGQNWQQVLAGALNAYQASGIKRGPACEESYFDAASRLGLIGCVSGGPPDLSSNPNYMEGFGENGS